MQRSDIAIIGAGIMGVSTACELARKGARVVVIDQARLPNPRAASVDHSKVFRFAYPDPLYAKLAVDALARWRALELRTGIKLHTQTGALLIARSDESIEAEYYKTLRSLGLECDKLDSRLVSAHFPQFNSRAFAYGVYDPSGAILHAEDAVLALIKLATASGVKFIEGERVVELKQGKWSSLTIVAESGHKVECERAMATAHEWNRAERATVVAAFADLEVADVREVTRVESDAGVNERWCVVKESTRRHFADEPVGLAGAEEEVDFGEGFAEFVGVAFDHAAHGGDHATRA